MNLSLAGSGYWIVSGIEEKYYGDLYLNECEGGIVIYIKVPNNGRPHGFLKLPLNIEYIYGNLVNGSNVILFSCDRVSTNSQIGGNSVDTFGYSAKFMIDGYNFEEKGKLLFNKIKFYLPNIIEWGDRSNVTFPKEYKDNVLIEHEEFNPISIYSCEQFSITYDLILNYSLGSLRKEKIELEQRPYIIIECKEGEDLEWYFKKIFEVKKIIEIAIGNIIYLSEVIGHSSNITYGDDGAIIRPVEIVHCFRNDNQTNRSKVTPYNYLFNLTELNTTSNITNWFTSNEEMEPIVELYIEDLYNNQLSKTRRFLNIVQALEIYHSRRICKGGISEYKKRVEKIISRESINCKVKYRAFLLGQTLHKNITLQQRLADLLLANLDIQFYTGEIDYYELPRIISKTRNYYIHYNHTLEKVALKEEELVNAYNILRVILEYYLLKELGFNKQLFILKKIDHRFLPIRTSIDVCRVNRESYSV